MKSVEGLITPPPFTGKKALWPFGPFEIVKKSHWKGPHVTSPNSPGTEFTSNASWPWAVEVSVEKGLHLDQLDECDLKAGGIWDW